MDGGLLVVDRPPRRWANGADKALVAARDRQLIETMRANPTASASVLAGLIGVGIGSITGRWRRLAARGPIVKDRRGHWRAVELRPSDAAVRIDGDEDEVPEFETPRATPLFFYDANTWVNHINYFVDLVFNPSPFACRKYGST